MKIINWLEIAEEDRFNVLKNNIEQLGKDLTLQLIVQLLNEISEKNMDLKRRIENAETILRKVSDMPNSFTVQVQMGNDLHGYTGYLIENHTLSMQVDEYFKKWGEK